MPQISVIICTHNPRAEYLRRVLEALQAQSLPRDSWELLLIDNASRVSLFDQWDLGWHPRARHVLEKEVGLTPARLRGIEEASGDLLVFVDDDNLLASDFLRTALNILAEHPFLGVFGAGVLEPEFEMQPPAELVSRLPLLALRRLSVARWSNNTEDFGSVPWGAGLCVTRRVANYYVQLVAQLRVNTLLDRRGEQLFCGGDDVFSWASVRVGQGFGVFPELRLTHLISAGRLKRRYFLRLVHAQAFSSGVLSYLRTGTPLPRLDLLRWVRLLLHGLKSGPCSMHYALAALRGYTKAGHFISEHRLQPLDPKGSRGCVARAVEGQPSGANNSPSATTHRNS